MAPVPGTYYSYVLFAATADLSSIGAGLEHGFQTDATPTAHHPDRLKVVRHKYTYLLRRRVGRFLRLRRVVAFLRLSLPLGVEAIRSHVTENRNDSPFTLNTREPGLDWHRRVKDHVSIMMQMIRNDATVDVSNFTLCEYAVAREVFVLGPAKAAALEVGLHRSIHSRSQLEGQIVLSINTVDIMPVRVVLS